MFRILVVEDNDAVALGLQHALRREGFRVSRGANMAAAKIQVEGIDLVILDIRLPDGDGYEFCQWLRAKRSRQSILMLTARDDLMDKIIALEVGADDYMTKPFEVRELIARVRALLRRTYGTLSDGRSSLLQVGLLEIDLSSQQVKRENHEIHLTSTEFKLLAFLAKNRNRLQSRQTLIEKLWGMVHISVKKPSQNLQFCFVLHDLP
jgi:DNA-binding response OmpR family regulator